MIRVTFFAGPDDPRGTTVAAKPGQSLMRAAQAADIEGIAADCGGALTCATCHVLVREPWLGRLPPSAPDEDDMLGFTAAPRQANSRLSCQIRLGADLDGLAVDLPPTQY
ncbi:MAG: 2Fe-2S iron-sulfur cluster binding domain-containing protein [Burkholderiales bacterium]|nr:2Fe-2S iron-sulfur cluster binding domain-containing protein [Burkholderiales bacterium]